ncbi:MAG: hypothetical protein E5X53_26380 [Mesorhizobium sp.]|uniref:hypothetical protein n=1 Tax=Mesorhizobium sp. TaxID=1871066 RepID=UPI001214712A|nr:hypothetical protein [Mesorhizobium sp.]TIP70592.1 MAG: hypothetical protein E5X55_26630 [Mesorhizobium sp.]TIQ05329.1 MAG: hypothetical protein E5X57_28410 [Mesorhizobium sp.]TIR49026.1 MAG: hypothetical protein E5X53_26380 [Mesorhizobium sp.]TJV94861.1 MAG: hypothetical protein E5X52_26905 [Mesorhizobium sp.]
MVETAALIWADGPSGSPTEPQKSQIRAWGTYVESLVVLAYANNSVYNLKSAMDANLVPGANSPALVVGDPTAGNDGLYMKVGATATGSWLQLLDFVPGAQIVHAVDVGAGTPNAIICTTNVAASPSGSQLVRLDVFEANTGSPVTVTGIGSTTLTIKSKSGADIAVGGLSPGPILGFISGTTFRLLSDQTSAAFQAGAEAAMLAAEGFRDDAEAYALAAQSVSTELAHPVTRAALKALNTATHTAAIVVEPNFERIARWDAAVDAYMNTADPEELVFAQPTPASPGAWKMSPIPKEQVGIFQQIKYRMTVGKVDFVGVGDSNQILGGFGWDHGFQYALNALGFPMWATGLISQNENNGAGSGQGYLYNRNGSLVGAVSGAPADLDKYLNKGAGGLFPAYYTYIANGGSLSSTLANGLVVTGTCPLDTSAALAFDGYYGTFTTDAGQFRPFARWEEAPFTTLSDPGIILTNTGAYGIQKVTLTAAADPARAGKQVGMRWTRPSATGITGPFFCTYMRVRNTDRTTGYAYGTLEYRGGQSARTMAYDLQQASNEALTHYFSILRADQGSGAKTIVICFNSGLNDRNETNPSVGTAALADGDSASAFVDNTRAIVDRIKAIWTLNGWDQSELFWLLQVSHPQSSPDDSELVAYRAALEAFALYVDQAQVIDISAVAPYADFIANNWYASPVDHAHLAAPTGYEQVSLRVLKAML